MPGRFCSFPNCPNKITAVTLRSWSFHRVPTADEELMKRWLLALQMDPSTPADTVKLEDHKVCSVHFDPEDFYPRKAQPAPVRKRRKGLRKTKPLKEHFERIKLKPHAVPKGFLWSKPEVRFIIMQNVNFSSVLSFLLTLTSLRIVISVRLRIVALNTPKETRCCSALNSLNLIITKDLTLELKQKPLWT